MGDSAWGRVETEGLQECFAGRIYRIADGLEEISRDYFFGL
jgi:hypothetical protein